MARYHGKSGVVYISTSAAGSASSVLAVSSWNIDRSTDTVEVTSFGDANKTYVQGLPDISGSFEGFWDDTEAKLFTAAASSDGIKMYLYPSSNAPSKYFYGPAWLSASMDCGVSDAVSVSGEFKANGSWGQTI